MGLRFRESRLTSRIKKATDVVAMHVREQDDVHLIRSHAKFQMPGRGLPNATAITGTYQNSTPPPPQEERIDRTRPPARRMNSCSSSEGNRQIPIAM